MKKIDLTSKTLQMTLKIYEKSILSMKTNVRYLFIYFALISCTTNAFSQVGINNENPKITLDVHGISDDILVPDGIIAPRLTKKLLIAKNNSYTSEQTGAIIYITDATDENNTTNSITDDITSEGYYFFNGTKWLPFSIQNGAWKVQESNETPTNQSDNIYQTGNVAIGTNTTNPTDVQLNVNGNEYVTGKVKVGGTSSVYTSPAQLELADENKGILINKVSLQGRSIKEPIPDVVEGIMVYNTETIAAEGISPGFYYWDGSRWMMLNNQFPEPSTNNLKNLQVDCASKAGNANTSDAGTVLDFGDIVMTQDGSYAFTLRLYGTVANSPTAGKAGFYYLALVVDDVIIDSVELDLIYPALTTSSSPLVLSSTTTLMGVIKAGQKVEVKLTNHTSSPYTWTLKALPDAGAKSANRTSMLWWKLS